MPREVISADYSHGVDTLTMRAINSNQVNVLIVDDLQQLGNYWKQPSKCWKNPVSSCRLCLLDRARDLKGREAIGDYDYKVLMLLI